MRGAGSFLPVRHGESTANVGPEFTSLLDAELTYLGAQHTRPAARLLVACHPLPDLRAPGSGESLQDVIDRVRPCGESETKPELYAGHSILVVNPGSCLRALCCLIDGLDGAELASLKLLPRVGHELLRRVAGCTSLGGASTSCRSSLAWRGSFWRRPWWATPN